MGISEAIAAGKALVEVSKLARDLVNNPDVNPHQVRATVQEMLIHLTNAQAGLAEAQQEIMTLRSQLADRESLLEIEADMEFQIDGGFYVRKSEKGRGCIAYCPVCWKKDGKTIPMAMHGTSSGCFRCTVHNTVYRTAEGSRNESAAWSDMNNQRSWRG
jgi:polyhydroxyalkanoate synthesis regulator phasin